MLKSITAIANAIRTLAGGLLQVDGPGSGTTITMTAPNQNFTAARTDAAQSFTGAQTFGSISVGNAEPSASGAGITFPATQSASTGANTLDDYEEGTWTPTQGTFATWTSPTFVATYTKVGRLVTVSLRQTGGTIGWASGASMSGLPFAPTSTSAVGYAIETAVTTDNGPVLAWPGALLYFVKANASENDLCLTVTYQTS